MLKLSYIVPIYKVEIYLKKCIDSLLQQDLPQDEYEIILVDDGSPDGCPQICDDYALAYPNLIRVIHRKNGGLSAARNSGLEIAEGKYVQFVDSDDYIEPNTAKILVEQMLNENLDILKFDYQNVRLIYQSRLSDIDVNHIGYISPVSRVFERFEVNKTPHLIDTDTNIVTGDTYLAQRLGYACYATQFVLRRELLLSPNKTPILFKDGIYYEDTEWTPRIMLAAQRVNATTNVVYNYLYREGSISRSISEQKRRKVLNDKLSLIDSLQLTAQQSSHNRWFKSEISGVTMSILQLIARDFWNERHKLFQQLKDKQVYPLTSHFKMHNKWKMYIANISPLLYCTLLRLKR
ncbi:MAG: glycosyltransferase [Paludibacteraceae bacterium]|nr:glycosyltransferase [Paludibacteraceae bacterium]